MRVSQNYNISLQLLAMIGSFDTPSSYNVDAWV